MSLVKRELLRLFVKSHVVKCGQLIHCLLQSIEADSHFVSCGEVCIVILVLCLLLELAVTWSRAVNSCI